MVVTIMAIAFGVCPHEAAAQKPPAPTLPPIEHGPGGYLSLVKLGLIAVVFLLWVRLADWVNRDSTKLVRRLEMDPVVWNPHSRWQLSNWFLVCHFGAHVFCGLPNLCRRRTGTTHGRIS